ncbi:MAG: methyltransferase domain-containing protein [Candidatus Omnitrophica bacterium]|nr:methyltransferase domain-containing protein [Candidatus Omnitrophota bacterium]
MIEKEKLAMFQSLRCPVCKNSCLKVLEDLGYVVCSNCAHRYEILGNNSVSLLPEDISQTKVKIQRFWGDLCKQWYTNIDSELSTESLNYYLVDLELMFKYRKHLAVIEMPLKEIRDKQILEIGSGGGAHSALFKQYGANVTAVDITKERVISTAKKLALIKEGAGLSLQADAENLPFINDSFDFVYSNGVLHHSENTERCIKEVLRVLKPGGKAVLMLYSRHSATFWLNLLPHSIFSGMIFRYPEPERIGILTEGKPKFGSTKNPITRIYSKRELMLLLKDFKIESLRKNSFSVSEIPILSRISQILVRIFKCKAWKSGILIYGSPYYAETKIEMKLGETIGFAWNIIASKKVSDKH